MTTNPDPYGRIPPQQQRHGCRRAGLITLAAIVGLVVVITIIAVATGGGSSTSSTPTAAGSSSSPAAASTAPARPDRVCFDVTGTGTPSISYGNDSDSRDAGGHLGPLSDGSSLPWHACMPANRDALYWNVTAQLEGHGDITATVTEQRPDGTVKTLATAHAAGGYQIANAEYAGYVGP